MSASKDHLEILLIQSSDLTAQQIAEIGPDVADIVGNISWIESARLEKDTKQALIDNFIDSLRSAEFRHPVDMESSVGDITSKISHLFAEYVFVQLWSRRDILNESEASLLYTLLVPVLSKSHLLNQAFSDERREEMIIGFIADKILIPVAEGRDTTNAWSRVTRSWHLLGWMNNYLRDYLKKRDHATLSLENDDTQFTIDQYTADRNQRDTLTDTEVAASWEKGDGWSPDLLEASRFSGGNAEADDIVAILNTYKLEPDTVCQECVAFIENNDAWVQLLLANAAAENTTSLDRFGASFQIKSVHYKAAKLGIISRKSYPAGSDNIRDYHQNTELGRWMANTFHLATPLQPELIHTLFKLLCTVALKYHDP